MALQRDKDRGELSGASTPSSPGSQLALVQLPRRMRRALKLFRKITGMTAVTSLTTSLQAPGKPFAMSPPVHPRCAKKLRSIPNAPCGEQWLIHVRSGRRSRRVHTHTCPIGLRCSCVPIHFGDQLVGVAKLVVDSGTSESALNTAVSVLKLVVSETCQDTVVALLSEELRKSRQRLTDLQHVHSGAASGAEETDAQSVALVDRVLDHLQRQSQDPTGVPAVRRQSPRVQPEVSHDSLFAARGRAHAHLPGHASGVSRVSASHGHRPARQRGRLCLGILRSAAAGERISETRRRVSERVPTHLRRSVIEAPDFPAIDLTFWPRILPLRQAGLP